MSVGVTTDQKQTKQFIGITRYRELKKKKNFVFT